jgi:two-component system, NarL family, nitrate/nitrite response regulator NarL
MPKRLISVVVADDHPLVLRGLTAFLEREPDLSIVASCSGGTPALEAIRTMAPQVAVLDIGMPDLSGPTVLAKLVAERSRTKIIFLTGSTNDCQVPLMIAQGARGLVLKDAALHTLADGIREVANNGTLFAPHLVKAAQARPGHTPPYNEMAEQALTAREREVMLLTSQGLSNREVGQRLALAEGTVKLHLHHIYQKVGVANRTALTVRRTMAAIA